MPDFHSQIEKIDYEGNLLMYSNPMLGPMTQCLKSFYLHYTGTVKKSRKQKFTI